MKNTIKSLFIAGLVALTASCDIVNFDKPGSKFGELCFTCTSGNVAIAMTKKNTSTQTAPDISLLYSKDKTSWLDLKIGDGKGGVTDSTSITLAPGEKVYFKAKTTNDSFAVSSAYNYFTTTSADNGKVDVSGNIMTLLDGSNPGTTLTHKYTFNMLFAKCTAIQNAVELSLPATNLANSCYCSMFYDCKALATAPALPATTLIEYCYSNMFAGCTALTNAPDISATTLAEYCCNYMFSGCKALTTAPALPATNLAKFCYNSMFNSCSALTNAPSLPATTLVESCYSSMFAGCKALTTAPTLPATTLAESCYSYMFQGCAALTNVPDLPATTLANSCCMEMFLNCISLKTGPALPATSLKRSCYNGMFKGCTALTTAPTLPATTLEIYCYLKMFQNCSKLSSVTMLATDVSATDCLNIWLKDAGTEAGTHTLYVDPTMTGNATISANKGNFTVAAYSGN